MKLWIVFIVNIIFITTMQATTLTQVIDETLEHNSQIKKQLRHYEKMKKSLILAKTNYYPVLSLDSGETIKNSREMLALESIKNYQMQTLIAANSYKESADELILKIKEIYIDLITQRNLLKNCKENHKNATHRYQITQKAYREKLTTKSLLKQSKESWLVAKENLKEQRKNISKSILKYKKITNKLVDVNSLKAVTFNHHLPEKYEEIYRFVLLNTPKNVKKENENIVLNIWDKTAKKNPTISKESDKLALTVNYHTTNDKNKTQVAQNTQQKIEYDVSEMMDAIDEKEEYKEKSLAVKDESQRVDKLSTKFYQFIDRDKVILTSSSVMILFGIIFLFNHYRKEEYTFSKIIDKIKSFATINRDKMDKLLYEKELQVALVHNNKNHLLYDISHELSSPINKIANLTELLKKSAVTSEQKRFIKSIENNSINLLATIDDIVNRTELYSEKTKLDNVSFDLFEKIEFIAETYAKRADDKKIELGICIDPSLPRYLMGDGVKLSQVLSHIVRNAIKFTSQYGTVNLSVQGVEQNETSVTLRFVIADTGVGMSKEKQNEILHAFEQTNTTNHPDFSKIGWGLIISHMIINLMGGRLKIESQEDEGSTLSFEICLEKDKLNKAYKYPNYENLKVGLALPHIAIKREVDENLQEYANHLGVDFSTYFYDDLFNNYKKVKLPDLLFVDHKYTKKLDEMKKILNLNTNIILITSQNMKKSLDIEKYQHIKSLNKPITMKRVAQVIENHTLNNALESPTTKSIPLKTKKSILLYTQIKLQASIYISIFDSLGYSADALYSDEEFIEKLANYDYAIFDEGCFGKLSCSIATMARKSDTIPLLFTTQVESPIECMETLNSELDVHGLKQKLEIAK